MVERLKFSSLSVLDKHSADYFLSPSVHKGLDFSLEALRELSRFTTASNKQLPFEKVGFGVGHGLLPPLLPRPHPGPLALP